MHSGTSLGRSVSKAGMMGMQFCFRSYPVFFASICVTFARLFIFSSLWGCPFPRSCRRPQFAAMNRRSRSVSLMRSSTVWLLVLCFALLTTMFAFSQVVIKQEVSLAHIFHGCPMPFSTTPFPDPSILSLRKPTV